MQLKAIGHGCVTHTKEQSELFEKRRGSPRYFWFDWQHFVQQHLVNHLHGAM